MPAEATAAASEAEKPAPGSLELIQYHAEKAQADFAERLDADGIDELEENAIEKPQSDKPRGEDGKFKPKDEKAAKVEPVAKTEPTPVKEKPAPAEPVIPESIVALRDLVAEGKIADALKALGVDAEKGLTSKQWTAFRKDNEKAVARSEKVKAEAAAAYQHVERVAAGLEQQFGRYRAAQTAYQAGDFDAAFQYAFGEDLNSFQQKAISRMANRDPEVARLRQELQARDARQAQMAQQAQAQQEQQSIERERADYIANLAKELTELDDPRIPRAAGRKDFVQRVFAAQAAHLVVRRDGSEATISTREAAELALAELEQEYTGLRSVFDGEGGAVKPARSSTGVKPGGKTPTRPVSPVRPAVNLKTQEAAEAHREVPLRGKALLEKHVRLTAMALKREREGVSSD